MTGYNLQSDISLGEHCILLFLYTILTSIDIKRLKLRVCKEIAITNSSKRKSRNVAWFIMADYVISSYDSGATIYLTTIENSMSYQNIIVYISTLGPASLTVFTTWNCYTCTITVQVSAVSFVF